MSAQETPGTVAVKLPCGFIHEGKLYNDACIIPMTGRVRKLLARPDNRRNPVKVIDALLMQCVVSVGPIDQMKQSVLSSMFVADRDFLVVEIRKISLGNEVNTNLKCDACNASLGMTVDLERDVPVRKLDDIDAELEDDMLVFRLANKSLGVDAKFRLPTGSDQNTVAALSQKNPVEANYVLYRNCLLEWDGKSSDNLPANFFEDLSLPVIDFIDESFMENMPGPDLRVPAECYECGKEIVLSLASSDFLFRVPKKERT